MSPHNQMLKSPNFSNSPLSYSYGKRSMMHRIWTLYQFVQYYKNYISIERRRKKAASIPPIFVTLNQSQTQYVTGGYITNFVKDLFEMNLTNCIWHY